MGVINNLNPKYITFKMIKQPATRASFAFLLDKRSEIWNVSDCILKDAVYVRNWLANFIHW